MWSRKAACLCWYTHHWYHRWNITGGNNGENILKESWCGIVSVVYNCGVQPFQFGGGGRANIFPKDQGSTIHPLGQILCPVLHFCTAWVLQWKMKPTTNLLLMSPPVWGSPWWVCSQNSQQKECWWQRGGIDGTWSSFPPFSLSAMDDCGPGESRSLIGVPLGSFKSSQAPILLFLGLPPLGNETGNRAATATISSLGCHR